jgi:hypothetical protein
MYSLSRYQHGTRRHLARQAQRTAEDARALVELAAFAVEAEQGRKIEREAHEDMPAEYGGEEEVPEQGVQEYDQAKGHSIDLENGRQSPGDVHDSGYISQERNSEENAAPESTGQEHHETPPTDKANQSPPKDWSDLINYPESESESEEQEIEGNGKNKGSD